MTVSAQLADGRTLNFPDGTDPSVIQATVKRLLGETTSAGFSGSDLATAFKSGAVGSTKALTDVAGAENAASQALGASAEAIQKQYSPARQAEMQAQAARMKQAETSGSMFDEIKAGARSIAEAPLQTIAQGVGSFVPYVPAMLLGPVAAAVGLGAKTVAALGTVANLAPRVMGTAQGIGAVKGAIYDTVYEKERESGVSEVDARAKASAAQEYTSKNIDQMALAGVIGYVAGSSGIEKLLTPKGAAGAAPGMVRRVGQTALTEAATEAPQGGQERLASNLALQREGYNVPTFQGVAGQATQEGLTGALSAGPIGAFRGPSAETPPGTGTSGAPPEKDAAAQARRIQLQEEQRLAAQGATSREGEAILNTEEAAAAKLAKEQEALAQKTMQDDYAQRRAEREAELKEAFPADYSDVMDRANRYGVLATELASLDGVRKTPEVRGRINTLHQRMADIAAQDDRIPNEALRMQQAQRAAAKKAGFPAENAARIFSNPALAQVEMREALPEGKLPPQTDLFGNPMKPTVAQPEGLNTVAEAELPLTSDVLQGAGLAPTTKELEAAGQQRLPLNRTPAGRPTSPLRDTPTTTTQTPAAPLPIVEPALAEPTQPGAITATEVRQFGTMSKANRQWLVDNVEGRTPEQVRDMLDADPTIMAAVPKGLQVVLKEIVANAAPKETPSVQPQNTLQAQTQQTNEAIGNQPSVGVPSELPTTDPVGGKPAAATSAPEPTNTDGLRLVPAGQPAGGGTTTEVASKPTLDEETQRRAEADAVTTAINKIRTERQTARAEPPAAPRTPDTQKATPKAAPEVVSPTGSPFDILNERRERRKAADKTAPTDTGRASTSEAVVEGQSMDSLREAVRLAKGVLGAALRRAVASGKIVLEFKHPTEKIGGYYDGSKVTLYADGIPAGQVLAVALHEIGAHLGFKKLFGARVYDNIIKQIQQTATNPTPSADRALARLAISRIPKDDIARGETVYGDETIAYFIEEATKAQNAGTLPKAGAVRALLNNIRLAMIAAVNRVFGSKIGVADFTTQDILSMAEGAFVRESFTAVQPAATTTTPADANAGRASKTAAKILGVNALDPSTQAAIDAIQAAMPKLDASEANNIIEQAVKGVADAHNKSGLVTTFRQAAADKFSTVESKVSQMFSQGARDFFGNLNPMVLVRQAEDSARLILDFYRMGGIGLTKDGIVSTRQEKQSLASALSKVADLGKASNLTYDKAKEYVSTVLEGHRLASIRDSNNLLEREAVYLETLGKNAAADSKRDEKIVMHMTTAEINTLEAAYQKSKAIQSIQDDLNATRTSAIEFMVATGRISKEQGTFWNDNTAYVPFSRVFEDTPITKMKQGPGISVLHNIPEMKGSLGRPVKNVLDAYANRLGYMVEESMKNHASVNLLTTMELGGYAKKLRGIEQATNRNLVVPRLYIEGKPVLFEVQNEYDLLAFQQAPELTNWLIKGLASTSRILRTTITAMPPFALKQVLDDAQRAMFTSGVNRPVVVGMKTLYNLPRTFFGEVTGRKSPLVRQLEAVGVIGDFDANQFQPATDIEAEIGAKKRGAAKQLLHRLEQFTKASDLAARLAVYEETLLDTGGKKQANGDITGGDTVLAQTRARELINFSRKGTSGSMRIATQVIPFFNAYAQGMDVLYRAASGIESTSSIERSAARKMFWSRVGLMSAMGMLYALSMSDDEGYKNASEDVRDNNWLLPDGIKLPVPRELGFIFKTIPERVVEYYRRSGTDEEQSALKALSGLAKSAVSAYGLPNTIPSTVRPILENMTNYSFFGQRELEPKSVQGQEPGYRSTSATSELAKALGESTNISPIKIDNLIRGMFGIVGSTTLMATDAITNPTRPDRPLYQLPFASIFLYDTIGGKAKTEFYDLRERVASAVSTYNDLKNNDPTKAEAYGEKNEALLSAAPTVNNYLRQLNDLGRMRRLLEQSTDEVLGMTGTERRKEIDEIRRAENETVAFVREMETGLRKP